MTNEWINKGMRMIDSSKAHYYLTALFLFLGLVGAMLIVVSMLIGWHPTSTFRVTMLTIGCFVISQNEGITYRLDKRWL